MATNYDPGTRIGETLNAMRDNGLISQLLIDSLSGLNKMRHQGIGTTANPEEALLSIDQLVLASQSDGTDVAWVGQSGMVNLGNLDNNLVKDLNLLVMTSDDGVHLFDDGQFKGQIIFEGAGNNSLDYDGTSGIKVVSGHRLDPVDDAADGELVAVQSNDTITTGSGNDTIVTGAGNDQIRAGSGKNVIDAGDGDNWVTTGGGFDTIVSGEGSDTILAGAGNDSITSGNGDDYIAGQNGNDTIVAGDGNDSVYGGAGLDKITVGDGDSLIFGGADNDTITAGDGNDTIDGGAGNDRITAGDGNNLISGGSGTGNDTIIAGSGADTISGGAGNDSIDAGTGNDSIDGGIGNDIIKFGGANGSIAGGLGNDTIYITGDTEGSLGAIVNIDGGVSGTDILNLVGVTIDTLTVNKLTKTADIYLDSGTQLHVTNVEKFVYDVKGDPKPDTIDITGLYTYSLDHPHT